MSYYLWGNGANVFLNWIGIFDEEKSDLWRPQLNWNYNLRTPDQEYQRDPWQGLWPASALACGDPTAGWFLLGQDSSSISGDYELWSVTNGGNWRPSYVMGQVTDQYSNPLAAVSLDLYLTSTGALVSSGATDSNGNYMLPTAYAGQNHYVSANYANSTLVGLSINTLTPNF